MDFVNFHNHSEYSFLGSMIRVEDLTEFSAQNGFKGCALSDTLSTFGFFKLTKECASRGLKPVYGLEIFTKGVSGKGHYPFILIARNTQGLHNLFRLNTMSHQTFRQTGIYSLPFDIIAEHAEGLSALVEAELIFHPDDFNLIKQVIERFQRAFDENFFVEINYTGAKKVPLIKQLLNIVDNFELPAIACCESRYFDNDKDFFPFLNAHREKSLKKNEKGLSLDTDMDFSLRTQEQFEHVFRNHPDLLENNRNLFRQIDAVLDLKSFKIPHFKSRPEKLREICLKSLNYRELAGNNLYRERLDYELTIVKKTGLENFFLIIGDIARFLRHRKIPFGWGRGSAVSSLILFLLGITRVDPVKHNLMFERFLNPGRKELPDIDIDICWKRRKEVFAFLANKFGKNNVSYLATVGRLMARSVIRNTAKTFKLPESKLHKILPHISSSFFSPTGLSSLVKDNLALSHLYLNDPEIQDFIKIASRLEGLSSHSSIHAGGVIILPEGINTFASLEYGNQGEKVAQITKEDLEETGFIKIDLLGLRFVTIIRDTMRMAKISKIDFEDELTLELLAKGDTTAVFQLESPGMRDLLRSIRPESVTRVCDVISLFRPGPIKSNMTEEYILRHQNRVTWSHDRYLENITRSTYGLIVYQEQVLEIAHSLAGMNWEQADVLRKALSSKNEALILSLKESFISGCLKRDMEESYVQRLFGILVDFGSYGFNRSHALAYAYNAFAGAYLKANYFLEFMLASLNNNIGYTPRLNRYIADIKLHGYSVLPVNINKSNLQFSIEDGTVRAGFIVVKYVGTKLSRTIVKERKEKGFFRDFLDFYLRMKQLGLNKKAAEYLIRAGAFDNQGFSRTALLGALEPITKLKITPVKTQNPYSGTLFEGLEDAETNASTDSPYSLDMFVDKSPDNGVSSYEKTSDFELENEATDLFLSFHPVDMYREDLERYQHNYIADLGEMKQAALIAYLYRLRVIKTKSQASMAFGLLSDNTGVTEVTIFPKVYHRFKNIIQSHNVYYLIGEVRNHKFIAEELYLFDELVKR